MKTEGLIYVMFTWELVQERCVIAQLLLLDEYKLKEVTWVCRTGTMYIRGRETQDTAYQEQNGLSFRM